MDDGIIGQEREQAQLRAWAAEALAGHGSLVLVAGEVGVGKTTLARRVLAGTGLTVLEGVGVQGGTSAFGPVVEVLRTQLRSAGGGPLLEGPLAGHLALLLPELGPPAAEGDRATLFEAIGQALAAIAARGPAAVFLDDLQWADDATLELLAALARSWTPSPCWSVAPSAATSCQGATRSGACAASCAAPAGCASSPSSPWGPRPPPPCWSGPWGRRPGPRCAGPCSTAPTACPSSWVSWPPRWPPAAGSRRARLGWSCWRARTSAPRQRARRRAPARGRPVRRGPGRGPGGGRRRPDVRPRAGHGRRRGARVAGGAAAARHRDRGRPRAHDLPARPGPRRLLRRGPLDPPGGPTPGSGPAVGGRPCRPAGRGRALGAGPAARPGRGGAAAGAAEAFCGVHAYRDAARTTRRALELWPEEGDEPARLDALERLAGCTELAGDLVEAATTWQEVADGRRPEGHPGPSRRGPPAAGRRPGAPGPLAEGAGRPGRAAVAFTAAGLEAEAAERLASAAHLRSAASFRAALSLLKTSANRPGRLAGSTCRRGSSARKATSAPAWARGRRRSSWSGPAWPWPWSRTRQGSGRDLPTAGRLPRAHRRLPGGHRGLRRGGRVLRRQRPGAHRPALPGLPDQRSCARPATGPRGRPLPAGHRLGRRDHSRPRRGHRHARLDPRPARPDPAGPAPAA